MRRSVPSGRSAISSGRCSGSSCHPEARRRRRTRIAECYGSFAVFAAQDDSYYFGNFDFASAICASIDLLPGAISFAIVRKKIARA